MDKFKDFIRKEVHDRAWTQRFAAETFGVSKTTIYRWLNEAPSQDDAIPDLETLRKISEATGVQMQTLFCLIYPDDCPGINLDAQVMTDKIAQLDPATQNMIDALIDRALRDVIDDKQ